MNRCATTAGAAVMVMTFALGGCSNSPSEAQISVTWDDNSSEVSLTDLECRNLGDVRSISSSEPTEALHWPQLNVKVGGAAANILDVAISDDEWFVAVGEFEEADGRIVLEDVTGIVMVETVQDGQVDYVPTGSEARATGYVTCNEGR